MERRLEGGVERRNQHDARAMTLLLREKRG